MEKIIHYCWFGGKPLPKLAKKCIKSWKKFLPDYKIIEWNEKNFDINCTDFSKKAYEEKKWAFVSDYVRMWAIQKYGGIYLDTDVYVLKDLSPLLTNKAFVGFENKNFPFTAVFGCIKNHSLPTKVLNYYDKPKTWKYEFEDNNTISVSKILIDEYACKKGNKEQVLKDDIHVYPDGFLCNPSNDSYTIHLFFGSWTGKNSWGKKKKELLRRMLKNRLAIKLFLLYSKNKN